MTEEAKEEAPHATRQRRRRLRPETVEKLRKLMEAGQKPADLARRYKLPYFTLYQIKRGWAYKKAAGPIQEERITGKLPSERKQEKIRELRVKGFSIDTLADASGYPPSTIRKVCEGIKPEKRRAALEKF